jgi:hypothetical protein
MIFAGWTIWRRFVRGAFTSSRGRIGRRELVPNYDCKDWSCANDHRPRGFMLTRLAEMKVVRWISTARFHASTDILWVDLAEQTRVGAA